MKRLLYGRLTIVCTLILLVLAGNAAWGMFGKAAEAGEKRTEALADLNRLQVRKSELEAQVANLSTDRGVEGELRERYMVAKGDEKVIVIPDDRGAPDELEPIVKKRSIWARIFLPFGE